MKDVIYISIIGLIAVISTYMVMKERRRANKIAYWDRVTKGANQAYLQKWINSVLEKDKSTFCLVYLNLVKFKAINDFYGYERGNELLKLMYDCITEQLKGVEKCSRISADNYIIFMKYETDTILKERLRTIAEVINERFNQQQQDEKYYHLTFGMGVYIMSEPSLGYSVMVDRANIARKNLSRRSHSAVEIAFYNEKDRMQFLREKEIEDQMEAALANGEFEVYLQPKLDLAQNEIEGAEALIRWNSPEKGLIPPAQFVDLFEKNGFIKKIDLFVFETICKYMRKWIDTEVPLLTVSVNLSRLHFMEKNFLDEFDAIRQKYDVPAKYLEFELTERTVFEETELLTDVMYHMREKGYSCSLDDFGSGYSSLNILKELPINVIKLDRGFFIGQYNEQSRIIIRAIINMAKELDMKTVAEGVDTPEQCSFLKESGCTMMQAFLYAKPMPIPNFESMFFQTGKAS